MHKIIRKLFQATKCSLAGLVYAFSHEFAFRLEVVVSLIVFPLAWWLATDLNQLLWLITAWNFVLIAELFNTAIEAVVDRVGIEKHQLAKHSKDAASAAVFYTLLLCAFVWMCILYKNFIA